MQKKKKKHFEEFERLDAKNQRRLKHDSMILSLNESGKLTPLKKEKSRGKTNKILYIEFIY